MIIEQVPKNPDLGADAERVRKEEQGKIDESEVLTEEELAEKEDLLKEVRVGVMEAVRGGCDGGRFFEKIHNDATIHLLICVFFMTGFYKLEQERFQSVYQGE